MDIHGDETTFQVGDDGAVETLQLGIVYLPFLQGALALARSLGKDPGQHGGKGECQDVDEDCRQELPGSSLLGRERTETELGQPSVELEVDYRTVQDAAETGGVDGFPSGQQEAGTDDDQEVEKGVGRGGAAGQKDQDRDEQEVPDELEIGKGRSNPCRDAERDQ